MYVQRNRSANPYAAYQSMLEQRGLRGERGAALHAPEPQLARLAAPAVKSQLLAHAERYERLGRLLSGVGPSLGELAAPDRTSTARMSARVEASQPAAVGASMPATGARTVSTPAALRGDVAIAPGTPETAATLMSDAPRLRQETGTPASAATLTLGQVHLNESLMTKAELRGDNLNLRQRGKGADFGAITINGVTTTLGVFQGGDERQAAQFIADRLNANEANSVTATVDKGLKRLTLTSKIAGTAGRIVIDGVTADSDGLRSNDASTGFKVGDRADGQDGGTTDFGSVTVNGVTTTFGVLDNRQQTAQSATQWLVDRLNTNQSNDFLASVGGAARDQIVLTSKQSGSQGLLQIDRVSPDSDGNAQNAGSTGFVAGISARGEDAVAGVTELGSMTINGVTTIFGRLDNAGLTPQTAAQFMVDRLNANAANSVLASLGGPDRDRVVLTAKTPGSAGSFQIDRVDSDTDGLDNDGFSGWMTGQHAEGQDATPGVTDFGSITINGITTVLGVVDSRQLTTQSAQQYLVDRLNQSNPTLTASVQDGRLLLMSRESGPQATLRIDAVTPGSDADPTNDRGLGFAVGQRAMGSEEEVATGSQGAVAPPGPSGRTVQEPTDDPEQVTRVLGRMGQVLQGLNHYLEALQEDQPHLPKSVQRFRTDLTRILEQEQETLAGLGIEFKGDRLEADEATLSQAVRRNPNEATAAFRRLQEAIEPMAGAQVVALDQMRSAVKATSETASSISQVAASLFKIQHRASKVEWMMDQMQQAEDRMREQKERLEKAADRSKDDPKEKTSGEAPSQEANETPSFGLFRSPVPESFFAPNDASPASLPRWPDGR